MATADFSPFHITAPSLDEARRAREAVRAFAASARFGRSDVIRLTPEEGTSQPVEVPESAFHLFLEGLNHMAQGNAVTLVATHHELTTQQAANLLGVSRPFFVKLLESGNIPYHRIGSRRRVKLEHLMSYMEETKGESREALEKLAVQAQELEMGY